jgi:hypothetical protein
LWSQYANIASIINLFSHDSEPSREGKIFAPRENAGGFKMLFTGDAFELTNGIEKMINWNDARKTNSRQYNPDPVWLLHKAPDD